MTPAGTYPTGGLGGVLVGSVVDYLASQGSLAYDRAHSQLYAVNAGSNTISVFTVNGDRLTRAHVVSSGGNFPVSVAVHGNVVYVLNARDGGSVQGYVRIAHTLVRIPSWHRGLGLDQTPTPEFTHTPGQIAFTPDGSKIVITTKANGNNIDVFTVDRFGGLSSTPVVNADPGAVPFGVTFDVRGRLVVAEAGPNAVATFTISRNGTLSLITRSATGQAGTCLLLHGHHRHPAGRRRSERQLRPGVTIAAGDIHNQPAMNCSIGRTRTRMHIAAGQTATILVYDPSGGGGTIELKIFGAVVPPNDTAAAATPIATLPFTDEQYVGLATTDADDMQVSQACGLGPTPNSVWYTSPAGPGDGRVLFDTSKTTLPGFGMVIATGSPGALTPVSCGPGVAAVDTVPGTTYLIMLFSGSGQADQFRFDVSPAPPPAAGSAHFNKSATVGRDGTALVTGRYQCSNAAFFSASGTITQASRRVTRFGAFGAPESPVCDGRPHRLQVSVTENEGRHFRPGKAKLEFSTTACGALGCTFSLLTTQKITLAWGPSSWQP